MSYRLDRSIGYQPWGVTNPWVWADYGQPQRLRGGVSPYVMKTDGYYLKNQHLGQVDSAAEARAHRMEIMAAIGLTLTAVSFLLTAQRVIRQNLNRNRRRGRRRR